MRKFLAVVAAALVVGALPAAASIAPLQGLSGGNGSKDGPGAAAGGQQTGPAAPNGRAEVDDFLAGELEKGPAVVIVNAVTYEAAASAVEAEGLRVLMKFPKADAVVTKANTDQVNALARAEGVLYLEGNRPVRQMLTTAREAVRAPLAEQEYAAPTVTPAPTKKNGKPKKKAQPTVTPGRGTLDGRGVGVAIVDSGVAADHPMFEGRVAKNLKQVCLPVVCEDTEGDANDDFFVDVGANDTDTGLGGGHGTHVTGIAVGGRVKMADGSDISGMAPGASLYGLGSGLALFVLSPASSLNWVLENHRNPCGAEGGPTPECPPIKVVNNSYGSISEYNANGLYEKLSDRLVKEGVSVVWAAGNGDSLNDGGDGSDNRTNGPGASPVPGVMMVANYSDGDSGSRNGGLDSSSSRGQKGRPETYPDLSAPGTNITSSCRITLPICSPDPADPNFGTISGTSMASPMVAGAIALLRQAYPSATPGEIELALENSAYKFGDASSYEPDPRNPADTTSFDKGHGLLDVANALRYLDGRAMDSRFPGACPAGGVVLTDPEGDATKVALVDGGEAAYSAARDVTSIAVDNAGDGKTKFTVTVASLADPASDRPGGVYLESAFSAGGGAHELVATRDPAGLTSFTVDGVEVAGEFMPGTPGVITLTAPRDAFEPDLYGPVTFSGFSFRTRYDSGAVLAPVSDDGSGSGCVGYDVGGTAPPPPPPSFTPPEPEATVGKGQTLNITGGPVTDAQVAGSVDDSVIGPCDVTLMGCDERGFQLEPGTGSKLTVSITGEGGAIDLDLYVLGPDGVEVGRSASSAATEAVTADITKAGVYTVRIVWYTSIEGTYKGSISLQ